MYDDIERVTFISSVLFVLITTNITFSWYVMFTNMQLSYTILLITWLLDLNTVLKITMAQMA